MPTSRLAGQLALTCSGEKSTSKSRHCCTGSPGRSWKGSAKELEAEGWSWIEINPERDYEFINRCSRIKPQLVGAPVELVELKAQLDAEIEQIEQTIEEGESEELNEQQHSINERLDEVEEKLA